MVLRFFIFAVAFLISCTSEERDSVCDEKSVYYNGCVGGVSSSSVPSSSSGSTQTEIILVGTVTDSRTVVELYDAIKIGEQIWIARNLNYTDFSNSIGKCYTNADANCTSYGHLYNWAEAKTACLYGWHLPSDDEWNTLIDFAGGGSDAVRKLKAVYGWSGSGSGLDTYGFAALPGGYAFPNGDQIGYTGAGGTGCWWTDTEYNTIRAYYWKITGNKVDKIDADKSEFCSVRCVMGD